MTIEQRPPQATERRSTLLKRAEKTLAGGALGVFRLPQEIAFVAERGLGSRLWDTSGREYLDLLMGSGPMILGHAHPAVVKAVQQQVALGSQFYIVNEPAIGLAEALVKASPCTESVRFVSSGSEATFFALRLARAFTGRTKVLKFEGAFHGMHDYAQFSAAASVQQEAPSLTIDSAGIPEVLRDQVLVAAFNDSEAAESLIEAHGRELAAVIVEPLQRCLAPRGDFLPRLQEATRRHGALLVFDELITGFRLAYGGAQEYYGVTPDLACHGKILGGGYPLAALSGRADVMALCDARRRRQPNYAAVSGTFSGNPLAATAGLATLAELREQQSYKRLHAIGNGLRRGFEEIGRRRGIPIRTAGEGPIFHLLITETEPTDARSLARTDWARTDRFCLQLVRRGILLCRSAYLSTAHTDADIDFALAAADDVAANE